MLEELKATYGTQCNLAIHLIKVHLLTRIDTHTLISLPTNEQKKDWFLRLNPNGIY
jgi:glutathione S-transferase